MFFTHRSARLDRSGRGSIRPKSVCSCWR